VNVSEVKLWPSIVTGENLIVVKHYGVDLVGVVELCTFMFLHNQRQVIALLNWCFLEPHSHVDRLSQTIWALVLRFVIYHLGFHLLNLELSQELNILILLYQFDILVILFNLWHGQRGDLGTLNSIFGLAYISLYWVYALCSF
jgi:hypothetical protein